MQTHLGSTNVTKTQLISRLTILEAVPAPRVTATVDPDWPDMLTLAPGTILCGGGSFYAMADFGEVRPDWLKTFLRLRHGAPTHDADHRVFPALDPEQFGACLARWTQSVRTVLGGAVVALEGQTLRRALNQGEAARVIVSAWATESGRRFGQRKVRAKRNEITAVPELLRALALAGCIVPADARHCQENLAKAIKEADADYVLARKGNQGLAFTEVKALLDAAIQRKESPLVMTETTDKGQGRVEVRRYWQTAKLAWFADPGAWEGLRSVGVVAARRTVAGKESVERRCHLSRLQNDVEKFARAVRGHWGVENQPPWVLDVRFGADQSRARSGYAAEPRAQTRRLASNRLRQDETCQRGIKGKLLRAAPNPDCLKAILKI